MGSLEEEELQNQQEQMAPLCPLSPQDAGELPRSREQR